MPERHPEAPAGVLRYGRAPRSGLLPRLQATDQIARRLQQRLDEKRGSRHNRRQRGANDESMSTGLPSFWKRAWRQGRPADEPADKDAAPTPTTGYDEGWYIRTNPDVAQAIAAGAYADGYDHYVQFGAKEGRPASRRELYPDPDASIEELRLKHNKASYLVPRDLSVEKAMLRRTLVVGPCLAQSWAGYRDPEMTYTPDYLLASQHSEMPERLPHPAEDYDFCIIQIPLRTTYESELWRLAYDDVEGYRRAFETTCQAADAFIDRTVKWTCDRDIPTFVANVMVPQADLTGRLLPRYDLRNIMFFVEQLNHHIEASVRRFSGAYILDLDRISASLGRRYIQDDSVLWASHASVMPSEWNEEARIEPMPSIEAHYDIVGQHSFIASLWAEAAAMARSLRRVDSVKLVVVDLDDTLWSGVSGEALEVGPAMREGWPLGVAEALMYLKKRGVLLAIVSKNDEARIRAIWPQIFGGAFSLSDFAILRINWRRKAENMAEILATLNLLPKNTVFVDDNPAERADMKSAYPKMRVLGRYPLYLRRTLLWSSETQGDGITPESVSRTEMVQAQVEREAERMTLSREAFLETLRLKVSCRQLQFNQPAFKRALELLNKTNQFNTTGEHWTSEALRRLLESGGLLYAFDVEDKFTAYGLVGVCIVEGAVIRQFAMSCRIVGLDVELTVLRSIVAETHAGTRTPVIGKLQATGTNLLCQDLWERCGFEAAGGEWVWRGDRLVSTDERRDPPSAGVDELSVRNMSLGLRLRLFLRRPSFRMSLTRAVATVFRRTSPARRPTSERC